MTPADSDAAVELRLRPWRDASDFVAMSAIANRAAMEVGWERPV